jgi:multidrug resistance efflux pump
VAARRLRACPACVGLRARAEDAEAQLAEANAQLAQAQAQLAEAQAQLGTIQQRRASRNRRNRRKRRKRPASPSTDWVLVEEIRHLLNVSMGELAARLGLAYSTVLGKAQETPLSPGLREKLRALKREHVAAMAVKP